MFVGALVLVCIMVLHLQPLLRQVGQIIVMYLEASVMLSSSDDVFSCVSSERVPACPVWLSIAWAALWEYFVDVYLKRSSSCV